MCHRAMVNIVKAKFFGEKQLFSAFYRFRIFRKIDTEKQLLSEKTD